MNEVSVVPAEPCAENSQAAESAAPTPPVEPVHRYEALYKHEGKATEGFILLGLHKGLMRGWL